MITNKCYLSVHILSVFLGFFSLILYFTLLGHFWTFIGPDRDSLKGVAMGAERKAAFFRVFQSTSAMDQHSRVLFNPRSHLAALFMEKLIEFNEME